MKAELAFVDELKAAASKDVAKRYERAGTNGSWLTFILTFWEGQFCPSKSSWTTRESASTSKC